MNNKQKLELTWIGKEDRLRLQPRLRLLPAGEDEFRPDLPVRPPEALLKACAGPRCGCVSILIDFQPPISSGDF